MASRRISFTAAILLSFSNIPVHAGVVESGASSPEQTETLASTFLHAANDQKRIWTAPAHSHQRKYYVAAGVVMATTGALFAFDPVEARYFRNTTSFNQFNRAFSSNITGYGTLATPALLYAAGLVRKDAKMQNTALAAGEAVADAEILTVVLKNVTRRASPGSTTAGGNGTWFNQPGSPTLRGNGSFPSGHTISAFAVATVISRRYSSHRWVPWVAYSLAGAVGFSRMSESAHFASDVFLGGALGYSIGRLTTPSRKGFAGF